VRHELPDVTIAIDGRLQRSASTIATIGGYVVVVATALPELAVTLTSCYLGQIDGDSAASHLLLAPVYAAALEQHVLPGLQPGQTHARMCLLDHAAQLQRAIALLSDEAVQIDVGPLALQGAAAAWEAHDST
jgi:Ca2+/Na+ antiporter